MMIALHKNARTTPATRAEMAASSETAATLALRYGVSEGTVYKWKGRDRFHDASHTPKRLQTTLTAAQEHIVVELRKMLLLPLDDLLAVTREFICPQATRSGLDRCLRRYGVGNLNALKPKEPTQPHKAFKSYEPGFIHIDVKYLPQMPDETGVCQQSCPLFYTAIATFSGDLACALGGFSHTSLMYSQLRVCLDFHRPGLLHLAAS
jgi:transposase-like protein